MDEVSTVHECVTIMFQKVIPDHGVYHHLTSAHGSKFPKSSGLNISFQLSLSPTPDNWQQLIKNTGGNGSSCCAAPVSSINAIEGPHQPPDCKLHHLKGRNQHHLQDYTLRLLFPAILFMVQSPAVLPQAKKGRKGTSKFSSTNQSPSFIFQQFSFDMGNTVIHSDVNPSHAVN